MDYSKLRANLLTFCSVLCMFRLNTSMNRTILIMANGELYIYRDSPLLGFDKKQANVLLSILLRTIHYNLHSIGTDFSNATNLSQTTIYELIL